MLCNEIVLERFHFLKVLFTMYIVETDCYIQDINCYQNNLKSDFTKSF